MDIYFSSLVVLFNTLFLFCFDEEPKEIDHYGFFCSSRWLCLSSVFFRSMFVTVVHAQHHPATPIEKLSKFDLDFDDFFVVFNFQFAR